MVRYICEQSFPEGKIKLGIDFSIYDIYRMFSSTFQKDKIDFMFYEYFFLLGYLKKRNLKSASEGFGKLSEETLKIIIQAKWEHLRYLELCTWAIK